jgi:iron complex transport system substrate-binding protein
MRAQNGKGNASIRIVSLIPSATEIVAALGYAHALVGRSHECDEPATVRDLPACTGPRIDASTDSGEIHRQIQEQLSMAGDTSQAMSLYDVDPSLLEALAPDVVITQSQCSVCAASEAEVRTALQAIAGGQAEAERLSEAGDPAGAGWPQVVACEPNSLADVWDDIQRIATAIGDPAAGRKLVERLKHRLQAIADRARQGTEPPRVGCLEWLDPIMGCGNWIPELVEVAGGQCVFGQAGQHAHWLDWGELAEASVDRLVALPCGFDLERAEAELESKLYDPDWQNLEPVQAGQLYAADGHHYFNRPGPRLVESAAILAEICHPELFAPDHKGQGWRRQPCYSEVP